MARKDIVKDGVYEPVEVGSNLYVWCAPGPKPNRDRECVISSHGAEIDAQIASAHKAPGIPLYFYAPHGYMLSDASAVGVMRKRSRYNERVGANEAKQDYVLTKAQGRHSDKNKETYARLQRDWHKPFAVADQQAQTERELSMVPDNKLAKYTIAEIQRQHDINMQSLTDIVMDVVTVRERQWPHLRKTLTLFGIIEMLEKAGFRYAAVHCNFCRGNQGTHQISDNVHAHE